MRTQEEISNKVQQLMGILDDGHVEEYHEWWEKDILTWLLVNGRMTRNELIERMLKVDEIVCLLNSAQRKNYGLISSFLAEIAVIKWLLS